MSGFWLHVDVEKIYFLYVKEQTFFLRKTFYSNKVSFV